MCRPLHPGSCNPNSKASLQLPGNHKRNIQPMPARACLTAKIRRFRGIPGRRFQI